MTFASAEPRTVQALSAARPPEWQKTPPRPLPFTTLPCSEAAPEPTTSTPAWRAPSTRAACGAEGGFASR